MSGTLKVNGIIHGDPEIYSYVNSCEIIFAIELTHDLPALNKKNGEMIIVHYSSNYITYVRRGDRVECMGIVQERYLKHKKMTVKWLEANQLFNETLHFSFDY